MPNWIPNPITLHGETVDLIALDKSHFIELLAMAMDTRIWEFTLNECSTHIMFNHAYSKALEEMKKGNEFAFVVYHKHDKKLIGSTRFLNLSEYHKKLEVGWTWYHPNYWATEVNFECKLLLLTYAFEILKVNRVTIITDQNNKRSRKAIEKIGGIFEGIMRNDMIRDNGTVRSTAYYSIIADEWGEVKELLKEMYREKVKNRK